MFGILDAANGSIDSKRPKTLADRACDQCKQKKVRCSSGNPCIRCSSKAVNCTYDLARKKRGPPNKRLSVQYLRKPSSTPRTVGPLQSQEMQPLERINTATPTSYNETPYNSDMAMQDATHRNDNASMDTESANGLAALRPHPVPSASSTTSSSTAAAAAAAAPIYPQGQEMGASPDGCLFPSRPMESPSGSTVSFAGIVDQELPPLPAADIWPATVNETTLFTWIDVYFKRLHPTIPILSRTTLYCDMLLRKHRTDPQYGAMLLGLSAFAMTQPIQIHERSSMPSRTVQARMLMEECVKMRVAADFGETPTVEMILASFFLFACLFGSNQHKAARHRLREAVDLAYSLGLHLPDSYEGLEPQVREQWLRTYLVLSATERAYALQQNHPINFRGRPAITARFMQAFGPTTRDEYLSSLIYQEQSDSVSMTGLLYLQDTFDAIDESVINCWCGYCNFSGLLEQICETFDRRRALQMFRAQRRVREACISGNISFADGLTTTPLARLLETQQADITVTQCWLLNRLWQLCLSHQLLRDVSDHPELRYDYACHIAQVMLAECDRLTLSAMEVHGLGFAEKLCDVAVGVVTAVNSSTQLDIDSVLSNMHDDDQFLWHGRRTSTTIRDLLQKLKALLSDFRGGDHLYVERLVNALSTVSGFQT